MGIETIVMLALSYGASALAASLADKPKQKNFARDDKPTTLADRGSYIPMVIGRRLIGYLFGWAGRRVIVAEATGAVSGKGGSTKVTYANVYHEDGWHILCIGPASALHAIRQDGKVIWEGPIDRTTTPSGSVIDLGQEGAFQIWWGECDQPVNDRVGDAFGIFSGWPHICSLYWISKRLGAAARWPTLDYEIEVLPVIVGEETVAETYYMTNGIVTKYTSEPVDPPIVAWSITFSVGLSNTIYSSVMTKDGSGDLILSRRRNVAPNEHVLRIRNSDGAILWTTDTGGDAPAATALDEEEESYFHNYKSGTSLARIDVTDGTLVWENTGQNGYSGAAGVAVLNDDAEFRNKGVVAVSTLDNILLFDFETGQPISAVTNDKDPLITTQAEYKQFVFKDHFTTQPEIQHLLVWREGRQLIVTHTTKTLEGGAPVQTDNGLANIVAYDIDTGDVVWRGNFLTDSGQAPQDMALVEPAGDNPRFVVNYNAAIAHAVLSLKPGQEGIAVGRCAGTTFTVAQPRWDNNGQIWTGNIAGQDITAVSDADPSQRIIDQTVSAPDPRGFNVVPRTDTIASIGSILNEGIRPDVALKQLLTATYPHGAGIPPTLIDCQSIADMAQVTIAEGLGVNILLADGIQATQAVADLMQDVGMMMYESGNALRFQTIREVTEAPLMTSDFIVPPEPEIDYEMGPKKTDRMVFIYKDRTKNYRDVDIQIDDDSSMSEHGRPKIKKVQITNVTKQSIAATVANRRQQEELTSLIGFRFTLTRDGVDLRPGQIFILEDVATMICMAIEINTQDRTAQIDAVQASYASVVPDFIPGEGFNSAETLPVAPDAPFFALETPFTFNNGKEQNLAISVVRNRAHQEIAGADVWISNDNTTFDLGVVQNPFAPGGPLDDDFDTTKLAPCGITEDGPRFTTDDPEGIITVEDLDPDENGWRLGVQVCIIADIATGLFEIFFLRSIEALGGNQFRLKGLISCRGESSPRAHVIGDRVMIFRADSVRQQLHPYLNLDQNAYIKTQPRTSAEVQPLDEVTSQAVFMKGNAFRPLPLSNFFAEYQVWGPVNEWPTGTDIDHTWTYRIKPGKGLGAGELGAGIPIGTEVPEPEGTFTIVFTDLADVVKRTVTGLTSPAYTYTNVDLVADFGGEPTSYKANVKHINGAYSTDVLEITVTRV